MLKSIFSFFSCNRIEQRGFLAFTVLLIVILFVPFFIKLNSSKKEITYDVVYLNTANTDVEHSYPISSYSEKANKTNTKQKFHKKEITYFKFDPNNLDYESWRKLGFSDKQIAVIKKYESKGGRFHTKEDLAKIYVISDFDYKRLEPFIEISSVVPDKSNNENSPLKTDYSVEKSIRIDINRADTSQWQLLKGIGPVLANRIVKFRNILGGFYKTEQIQEVYGLPIETYHQIKQNLYIDSSLVMRKININTCSTDSLAKHTYINRKQANTIVSFRKQHGAFINIKSLSAIKSLDSIFLRKIEPYLEF